jgi:hypothetical protein
MRKATPQTRASPFMQPSNCVAIGDRRIDGMRLRMAHGLMKDQVQDDQYDQRNAKQPAE